MNEKPQYTLNERDVERDELEVDVLLVGAGPANLACALHLQGLLKKRGLEDKTVLVLDKAEELGHHTLSGAVMNPIGISELVPNWKAEGFPIECEVTYDAMAWLRPGGKHHRFDGMLTPPQLKNHGNYIVSLNKVVRWLAERAEGLGVDIYPGFAAAEVLYDGQRVLGVQTRDSGLARDGSRKATFEPGMNIRAGVTVFGEGTRGNLAKDLIGRLGLDQGKNPQTYGTGVKEIWEIPAQRAKELYGSVFHVGGYPLGGDGYGGGWVYGISESHINLGFVVGLDHHDAKLDPHALFVKFKQHPFVAELIAGGKVVRYGAKTLPEGGYFAMPRFVGDGFCLVGDTAGFLNTATLKGIHLSIKSGMLAAEAIAEALAAGDTSREKLELYPELFEASWAKQELWKVRNFRQAFDGGMLGGMLDAAVQQVSGGRGLVRRRGGHADHSTTRKVSESRFSEPKYNDTTAMDKLTDVYFSGAIHEEDQPSHLLIRDPSICVTRCTEEYGNPCQRFCPAAVYEWPQGADPEGVQINASNCVHCKTCDIADPYENIEWVVPEGGGGPKYIDM
ncbi:MAG: electron transfer flavoprotein-ubiquinone oxidoreductase [bacterium]|jgi:electron-transferring-flavoprotein dehydrogenase|nr:electron transfer flavoprotein-ubiquinone oxidoreductase [Planctomycetota bacterium]HIL52101.1 electron transfer flavoprotein-ubiquinone oxidoreductase [Planctomycetota bacterium]